MKTVWSVQTIMNDYMDNQYTSEFFEDCVGYCREKGYDFDQQYDQVQIARIIVDSNGLTHEVLEIVTKLLY